MKKKSVRPEVCGLNSIAPFFLLTLFTHSQRPHEFYRFNLQNYLLNMVPTPLKYPLDFYHSETLAKIGLQKNDF